ncbi:peptidylprolyl isomerase [Hymenobacter sp. BT559]|uniref:peptidylprolyl isomerase n=1 Tax=Hymenobacter sp. BT559 TaxID=2795729 RepID=UPI0018EAC56C|nr:peptidylprolyl isomerase [Hymenobacter sp. BT559]MBJ6143695.1 peptidylprolyl isomerase [Hymenobacter sp. BT559]
MPLLAQAVAPPAHPYADATRRRIATAQDERRTTELLPFLTDKNPTYRGAAAEALGSVQDPKAVPALLPLLRDAAPTVRRAAAYALGQTGDSTAVPALGQRLAQPEPNALARRATYEALGRCVTKHSVSQLWIIKVPGTDSAAAPGRAWGLYRAALRGLAPAEAVSQATKLLGQKNQVLAARTGASAALTRMRGQDSTLVRVALPTLLKGLSSDPNYFVRANCATALGRVARPVAYAALAKASTTDADHRVRIAALRALPVANSSLVGNSLTPLVVMRQALRRPLAQESLTGAEGMLKVPFDTVKAGADYLSYLVGVRHFRARATLLQAVLRHVPATQRPVIADTIRRRYERTPNQYEKAALLTALGEDPAQFDFVAKEAALTTGPPVVPGTALGTLVAMRANKRFPTTRQADFTAALRRALAGGDEAQLSTAAEAMADPKLVPAPQPEDVAALRQARDKLTLPREIEPWIALQQALDKLEKVATPTPIPRGTAGQHPIDWAVVQSVPVGQRVRLITTQGPIELELKVVESPGAVASFVSLVRQHFYDGLYFHRVVPNFMVQGGDPRGDGSGSTPYTLRSELAQLTYGAGAVGLASAGKDTESCQFFVTHLPTPHLDGRYPIFAQVVRGLDVVQRLDIGDRITTIALLPAGASATALPSKK